MIATNLRQKTYSPVKNMMSNESRGGRIGEEKEELK